VGESRGVYLEKMYPEFYKRKGIIETKTNSMQTEPLKKFRHSIMPLQKIADYYGEK